MDRAEENQFMRKLKVRLENENKAEDLKQRDRSEQRLKNQ